LNADGSLDTSFLATGEGANFTLGGGNFPINSVAIQADGRILIGGGFNSFNGATRWSMARLNADGSVDRSFLDWPVYDDVSNGANMPVASIVVQPDGRILVGGGFTKFNEYSRGRIARLLN
jgi:uncharacterized delta-60 repeat protein